MISAHEVQTAQFRRAGSGKPGYDEAGVDDYLDRIVATLEAIEHGGEMPADALSANDVVEVVFAERGPQSSGGYDLDDVDDLLDRVAQRINTYEAGVRKAAAPVAGGLPHEGGGAHSDGQVADERRFDGARDERTDHDGRAAGLAGAGAAGAAATHHDRHDDRDAYAAARGDRLDGDRFEGDRHGRDGREQGVFDRERGVDSGRGFDDGRGFERDERRRDAYADPAAPELQDVPRGDAYDDGGVRDGAALAEAGGAPVRDERGFGDERGFESRDDRRAGFGDSARTDSRERGFDERFDGRDERTVGDSSSSHHGAGLGAAAGGAVAADAVAHSRREDERGEQNRRGFDHADERRGEFGEPGVRADDHRGFGDGDGGNLAGGVGARDQHDVTDARDGRFGTDGDLSHRSSDVNMVGGNPMDEAPIVAPGESARRSSRDEHGSAGQPDEGRDQRGLAGSDRRDDAGFSDASRSAEERFNASRRDDVVPDGADRDGLSADGDMRNSEHSNVGGIAAGAAGGVAAGGFAAHHHDRDAADQGDAVRVAPADEGGQAGAFDRPVESGDSRRAQQGDLTRAQHDAVDYHDRDTAHSDTFAEPTPHVNTGEARPVAAAEQTRERDDWAFDDNGLRGNDEARGGGDLRGDAPVGGTVASSEAIDERPAPSEPEIISYPATDRRVPLPRNEARSSMSDEDREAEAQYHPEYSAYSNDRGPDAGFLPGQGGAPVPGPEASGDFRPFEQPSDVSERPLEAPSAARRDGLQRDPFADDARHDGSFDVAGGADGVTGLRDVRSEREASTFGRDADTSATAEPLGGRSADGPQRVAPMNDETARVREPHREGGFEQPGAGGRDPFADDARGDGSFDVAGGADGVSRSDASGRGTTADAPGASFDRPDAASTANTQTPQADDTRAESVGRPDAIDRPEPIDKAKGLPARDDTSRKGLLRRIFKG